METPYSCPATEPAVIGWTTLPPSPGYALYTDGLQHHPARHPLTHPGPPTNPTPPPEFDPPLPFTAEP
jgi:hypothetical protein